VGELLIFGDRMDTGYTLTLYSCLVKPGDFCIWPNDQRFQLDDNDCNHGSHHSRTWLHNNRMNLTELSPYWADLHFIANLWAGLNQCVELHRSRSIQKFTEIVIQECTNASQLLCSDITTSLSGRMRAVVAESGFNTRYLQWTVVV
jgi:hypothetical protein